VVGVELEGVHGHAEAAPGVKKWADSTVADALKKTDDMPAETEKSMSIR
jgi:hypothetical protein